MTGMSISKIMKIEKNNNKKQISKKGKKRKNASKQGLIEQFSQVRFPYFKYLYYVCQDDIRLLSTSFMFSVCGSKQNVLVLKYLVVSFSNIVLSTYNFYLETTILHVCNVLPQTSCGSTTSRNLHFSTEYSTSQLYAVLLEGMLQVPPAMPHILRPLLLLEPGSVLTP